MQLRLYDTLTKEKRPFTPLDPSNVRMYVCGPTVYDFAHIGNARPVIVFDVLFRLLRHLYGAEHVTYVRNITDVDDKINARAVRDFPGLPLNEAIRKVTEVTANQFYADAAALGSLPPTFEPRATDFVLPRADGKTDMVTLIKQLIARGHAYEAGGEVLFDTASMPDYGALSGRKLDEQRPGARVAVDAHKKNPGDFVLWKQSSGDEPGWESPWGRGRPGWHIECSAMSAAYLGDVFDIHGGGLDLIFPHHENEIAQSRCAHGTPAMANYWMHNEFVQIEDTKMSKSLGNFVTIRELLADWPGEVLRLNMLKAHYRSPMDWTLKGLEESAKTLDDWYWVAADIKGGRPSDAVIASLSDDLNTPQMVASLHGLRNSAASGNDGDRDQFAASLRLLGFLSESAAAWKGRKQQASGVDATQVDRLIAERAAARARKDFKESDRIRDELAAMGVAIKDGKDADGKPVTTWEIA
ncbi:MULTISPECIES: cysteine--tRNA ligase [Bradyrhizobium]|jgi:cysteinyl-tRNA synthetase|uniref:Cysteine--tRNA ligase n=2 Tax=Bradyrhizobium TaxID=374 RepID=A0ABY0P7R0_9BRAD|nr:MULTISPECIES: cysteine--tRNA ligase [Bradyrhizobium]SDH57639.1 cysteinyl-tRNA synthetase [Bradyrhizobium ottawaense]SEE22772.1 cysteinyl-tRNA synthetase [Bradyrhizobium lablabi]